MMDRSIRWLLATALLVPAAAQAAPVAVLVRDAGEQDAEGALLVDLRLLNEGDEPQSFALPDRIEARVERSGDIRTVWLERARDVADHVIFMDDGVIVEEGSPDSVIGNPREERTKQFLARFSQGG